MKVARETAVLRDSFGHRCGVWIPIDAMNTLRRASLTLHSWAEKQCGTECGYIERDDDDKCYWHSSYTGKRWRVNDMESGALRRVSKVCALYGLHYFHQTDPRGCALYISTESLDDTNYSRGFAVCL